MFLVAMVTIAYADIVSAPSSGIALAAFLPIKALTSMTVFYGLFTDTGNDDTRS
jgi:hypothetical protein